MTGPQWVHAVLAIFFALAALLTITVVGKPRKPMGGGQAAFVVLVQTFIIFSLLWWWPE